MPGDDGPLDALARAVLDGEPVDWSRIESHDTAAARLAAHMKVVEAVARAHRDGDANGFDVRAGQPLMWGHLVISERLGRGAYGHVYRAWDTRLERDVALKLLPARGDAAAATMIREGRLLARVRHPNVVTIHGADRIGEHVGLWMELVPGRTLHEILADGEPIAPAETVRIGIELARAIQAVHDAGLLHRDIKAQNVMRADDGRIVLMDFGTGRDLAESPTDLTGTPLYLAPELFRGEPATVGSDVYSFGVLLFHLLTRAFPVHEPTMTALRDAHERNGRTPLRVLRPEVPRRLARLIERATSARPDDRFSSADAVSRELEEAAAPSSAPWRWYAAALVCLLLTLVAWPNAARPAIGILPFAPEATAQTDSSVLDSLSDGFVFELNRRLAQVDGLDVRSATSSLAFKGRRRDATAFGRELGVSHVVDGRVFGEAGKIHRVSASLVRVADDETVWSGSFVPDNNDLFAVQERIAQAIVNQLSLRFEIGQRRHDIDPDLQTLFYRARAFRTRNDRESTGRAVVLLEEIHLIAPSYVPATAALANALLTIAADRDVEPAVDPRAEPLALKAYAADPLWPEANAALGLLCAHKREWGCARRHFERAISLDPSLTATHTQFALTTLLPLGQVAEALQVIEQARAEDPISLDVLRALAHLQVENGLLDAAIDTSRTVMAADADLRFVEQWLGRALYLSGRPQEALQVFTRPGQWGYRAYAYTLMGRHAEARAMADAEPRLDARHVLVYAGLGDRDRAFAALEQAAALDPWRAITWMQRPEMAGLRADPRFDAVRRRLLQPRPLPVASSPVQRQPGARNPR